MRVWFPCTRLALTSSGNVAESLSLVRCWLCFCVQLQVGGRGLEESEFSLLMLRWMLMLMLIPWNGAMEFMFMVWME